MRTTIAFFVVSSWLFLAGCGTNDLGRIDRAPSGRPLASAADSCKLQTGTVSAADLRGRLPQPATYDYRLTYAAGGSTLAHLSLREFASRAYCRDYEVPTGSGSGLDGLAGPQPAQVTFAATADLTTDDGTLVGTFAVTTTFFVQNMDSITGGGFTASADKSVLRGSWRPSLNEVGYPHHEVYFAQPGPTDQGPQGNSLKAFALYELTYMNDGNYGYSQLSVEIGSITLL